MKSNNPPTTPKPDNTRADGPDDSRVGGPVDSRAGGPDDSRDDSNKKDVSQNQQDNPPRAGGPDDSRSISR